MPTTALENSRQLLERTQAAVNALGNAGCRAPSPDSAMGDPSSSALLDVSLRSFAPEKEARRLSTVPEAADECSSARSSVDGRLAVSRADPCPGSSAAAADHASRCSSTPRASPSSADGATPRSDGEKEYCNGTVNETSPSQLEDSMLASSLLQDVKATSLPHDSSSSNGEPCERRHAIAKQQPQAVPSTAGIVSTVSSVRQRRHSNLGKASNFCVTVEKHCTAAPVHSAIVVQQTNAEKHSAMLPVRRDSALIETGAFDADEPVVPGSGDDVSIETVPERVVNVTTNTILSTSTSTAESDSSRDIVLKEKLFAKRQGAVLQGCAHDPRDPRVENDVQVKRFAEGQRRLALKDIAAQQGVIRPKVHVAVSAKAVPMDNAITAVGQNFRGRDQTHSGQQPAVLPEGAAAIGTSVPNPLGLGSEIKVRHEIVANTPLLGTLIEKLLSSGGTGSNAASTPSGAKSAAGGDARMQALEQKLRLAEQHVDTLQAQLEKQQQTGAQGQLLSLMVANQQAVQTQLQALAVETASRHRGSSSLHPPDQQHPRWLASRPYSPPERLASILHDRAAPTTDTPAPRARQPVPSARPDTDGSNGVHSAAWDLPPATSEAIHAKKRSAGLLAELLAMETTPPQPKPVSPQLLHKMPESTVQECVPLLGSHTEPILAEITSLKDKVDSLMASQRFAQRLDHRRALAEPAPSDRLVLSRRLDELDATFLPDGAASKAIGGASFTATAMDELARLRTKESSIEDSLAAISRMQRRAAAADELLGGNLLSRDLRGGASAGKDGTINRNRLRLLVDQHVAAASQEVQEQLELLAAHEEARAAQERAKAKRPQPATVTNIAFGRTVRVPSKEGLKHVQPKVDTGLRQSPAIAQRARVGSSLPADKENVLRPSAQHVLAPADLYRDENYIKRVYGKAAYDNRRTTRKAEGMPMSPRRPVPYKMVSAKHVKSAKVQADDLPLSHVRHFPEPTEADLYKPAVASKAVAITPTNAVNPVVTIVLGPGMMAADLTSGLTPAHLHRRSPSPTTPRHAHSSAQQPAATAAPSSDATTTVKVPTESIKGAASANASGTNVSVVRNKSSAAELEPLSVLRDSSPEELSKRGDCKNEGDTLDSSADELSPIARGEVDSDVDDDDTSSKTEDSTSKQAHNDRQSKRDQKNGLTSLANRNNNADEEPASRQQQSRAASPSPGKPGSSDSTSRSGAGYVASDGGGSPVDGLNGATQSAAPAHSELRSEEEHLPGMRAWQSYVEPQFQYEESIAEEQCSREDEIPDPPVNLAGYRRPTAPEGLLGPAFPPRAPRADICVPPPTHHAELRSHTRLACDPVMNINMEWIEQQLMARAVQRMLGAREPPADRGSTAAPPGGVTPPVAAQAETEQNAADVPSSFQVFIDAGVPMDEVTFASVVRECLVEKVRTMLGNREEILRQQRGADSQSAGSLLQQRGADSQSAGMIGHAKCQDLTLARVTTPSVSPQSRSPLPAACKVATPVVTPTPSDESVSLAEEPANQSADVQRSLHADAGAAHLGDDDALLLKAMQDNMEPFNLSQVSLWETMTLGHNRGIAAAGSATLLLAGQDAVKTAGASSAVLPTQSYEVPTPACTPPPTGTPLSESPHEATSRVLTPELSSPVCSSEGPEPQPSASEESMQENASAPADVIDSAPPRVLVAPCPEATAIVAVPAGSPADNESAESSLSNEISHPAAHTSALTTTETLNEPLSEGEWLLKSEGQVTKEEMNAQHTDTNCTLSSDDEAFSVTAPVMAAAVGNLSDGELRTAQQRPSPVLSLLAKVQEPVYRLRENGTTMASEPASQLAGRKAKERQTASGQASPGEVATVGGASASSQDITSPLLHPSNNVVKRLRPPSEWTVPIQPAAAVTATELQDSLSCSDSSAGDEAFVQSHAITVRQKPAESQLQDTPTRAGSAGVLGRRAMFGMVQSTAEPKNAARQVKVGLGAASGQADSLLPLRQEESVRSLEKGLCRSDGAAANDVEEEDEAATETSFDVAALIRGSLDGSRTLDSTQSTDRLDMGSLLRSNNYTASRSFSGAWEARSSGFTDGADAVAASAAMGSTLGGSHRPEISSDFNASADWQESASGPSTESPGSPEPQTASALSSSF